MKVAFGRAPLPYVGKHYCIFTPEAQPPREAGSMRQLSRDGDLGGQHLDAVWDSGGSDLA